MEENRMNLVKHSVRDHRSDQLVAPRIILIRTESKNCLWTFKV